uniref:Uncharacterized protein n=1 Tax=Hyaloperonospora arabidopsidis (strain Emoy2) TaxID=559515 RepID=M4BJU3_HYAAE
MKRFKRLYRRWMTSRDNWSNESRARAKMGRTRSSARTRRLVAGGRRVICLPASCSVCKMAATELNPMGETRRSVMSNRQGGTVRCLYDSWSWLYGCTRLISRLPSGRTNTR